MPRPHDADRRRLLRGMALGATALGLRPLWALASPGQPTVLAGNAFDLTLGRTPVNITGRTERLSGNTNAEARPSSTRAAMSWPEEAA